MGLWECYDSASCLEGWQSYIRLVGLRITLCAAGLAFLAALIAYSVPAYIESRISFLTAPRHLTDSQKESLLDQLKHFKSNSAYFYAYVTSEESQMYAGELITIFRQAGWKTHGPVLFMDDEIPSQGVAIEVVNDSNPLPDEQVVFNALQFIKVQNLVYQVNPTPGDARKLTNSVAIRVGVRPKS